MTCSFCNKTASKQYYLCDCCLVNLERCNATAKNLFDTQEKPVPVIPPDEDTGVRTIECDSCLQRFRDDELLQHQKLCTTLLVFRCAVCSQDYMSKEGLWKHLDLHEVADENKQTECKEVRVAHSLLKCVLCNDQRGYQEKLYWQHVHEDHDGFFLQCSECVECFRSQKLLNDHVLNHCNAREQAVPSSSNGRITNQKHIDSKFSDSSHDDSNPSPMEDDNKGEQDLNKLLVNAVGEISQPLAEKQSKGSSAAKCPHCGKECLDKSDLAHHIKCRHPPNECDICGEIFTSVNQARYHKFKYHSEHKHKCPHCSMKFHQKTEYQQHLSKHLANRKLPSEIRQTHHTDIILPDLKGSSERNKHQEQGSDVNSCQDQYEIVSIKEEISVEETTLEEQKYDVDVKEEISAEETALDVDVNSSSSTVTHCPICGGQFGSKDQNHLAVHVEVIHQLYLCTICGIIFLSADQLNDHKDQQHSAHCFSNGNYNCQSISNPEPIETIKLESPHYASSFFENQNSTAVATVQELNPAHPADEEVSNCSSFDGWEVHSTVSVNEIETYVLSIEFGFRFKTQNFPSKGKMRYYQCRRIKVRVAPQCERKLLVFIPNVPDVELATVSLRGKHTCANAPPALLTRPRFNEMDCTTSTNLVKPTAPTAVTVQELNPSCLPDEDVSNFFSFDGWEVHSTIPVSEIESYVLTIEYGFRFKTQNSPSKGRMRYYNCRRIKVRVNPQCDRKLLVFIPNTDDADATVSLRGKHSCEHAPPELLARPRLNEMDCELLTNLVKSGVPSRDVRKQFRVVNRAVSDNQLRHALKTVRK